MVNIYSEIKDEQMLEFLLSHDVVLKASNSNIYMTADTSEDLVGEFVVVGDIGERYRGKSFGTAMNWMEE